MMKSDIIVLLKEKIMLYKAREWSKPEEQTNKSTMGNIGNIGFWCPYFLRDSLLPRCAAGRKEWGVDGDMNGVEDGLTPPEKT